MRRSLGLRFDWYLGQRHGIGRGAPLRWSYLSGVTEYSLPDRTDFLPPDSRAVILILCNYSDFFIVHFSYFMKLSGNMSLKIDNFRPYSF